MPRLASHRRRSVLTVLSMTALLALAPQPLAARAHAPASAPTHSATLPRHAMIAAANPLAVAAGLKVLRGGGSAVDAAVAMQAVLGLVEPQSSGLGGGAFMLFYDAKARRVTAYDGRETAPSAASPAQFLGADGKPMPFVNGVLGGISTGVPGAIAMLEAAQHDHGHLKWRGLFAEATQLADAGFIVSPRLAGMIAGTAPQAAAPDAVAYFTKADGQRYVAGDRLINHAYAQTLGRIAAQGVKGLLTGKVAADIVARVTTGPLPSSLTLADLAAYTPRKTEALCRPYRAWNLCTPPAPSGGLPVQEAMGLIAQTDIATRSATDEKAWFQIAQGLRLAYADRDRYEGDPAFVTVPTAGLLAPEYLGARAQLIGETMAPVTYGQPAGAPKLAPDATKEPGGTSHMVIVDAAGNVVSMTTSVESVFGSGRMVDGFFLNNQLTDFSFSPKSADGTAAANAVGPGKRPRSSMAPVIVLDGKGRFALGVGSPGGSSIVAYNVKALVAMLDWKMAPQDAVALPNLMARGATVTGDPLPPAVMAGLAARGMVVRTDHGEASGLHAIVATPAGFIGGADPRREGVARGF